MARTAFEAWLPAEFDSSVRRLSRTMLTRRLASATWRSVLAGVRSALTDDDRSVVASIVDTFPPLTAHQRATLGVLFSAPVTR